VRKATIKLEERLHSRWWIEAEAEAEEEGKVTQEAEEEVFRADGAAAEDVEEGRRATMDMLNHGMMVKSSAHISQARNRMLSSWKKTIRSQRRNLTWPVRLLRLTMRS
jgi:hypothetical protein